MSKAGVGTFVTEDHELASSGLALFDLPIVDTSLVNGKFVSIYPRTVLTDKGPHEFTIPSDGQDFTDMSYTRLEGKAFKETAKEQIQDAKKVLASTLKGGGK